MINILLFGSTGFIGKNIEEYFRDKKKIKVIVPPRKECDVLKYKQVKSCVERVNPDVVINAAYMGVDSNTPVSKKYLFNNLKIPVNILEACKNKNRIRRIIFFGSGLEYGDSKFPINERQKFGPKNFYAHTKTISSQYSLDLAKKLHLPLILIKPFNLYGPHDNKSVIYYVIKSILNKNNFSVTAGKQVKDFLYIKDLMTLIEKIIEDEPNVKEVEVFNAGSGKGILLKEALGVIFKLTHYSKEIEIKDYRDTEYFCQVADIHKAEKFFKWKPKVFLEEGIKKTIKWIERVEL